MNVKEAPMVVTSEGFACILVACNVSDGDEEVRCAPLSSLIHLLEKRGTFTTLCAPKRLLLVVYLSGRLEGRVAVIVSSDSARFIPLRSTLCYAPPSCRCVVHLVAVIQLLIALT
ncbi:hypothetical protein E2C01_063435 [Portunus trituberculatus]|uniref:Uncharacterized protein n=1 Tax=Portunus trituberculatus TaxID=210409 RepID=A0A5B7HKG4_PORTR|nr:hypothetical protein [Portunus trituberculatus]